ncbi:hypothetical protein [Chryseobacterium lathyri]|uniref:Uncharacterized protein n=1 Tax=Chryseobacterium lathyri TaxID=395933 RepID=A0ABT9SLC1_9FLAO|nr:hypothetical protein [Chryseobacterium lathyri]MDP9959290.1 hypothetical protein [Chryseobacterium lathyri]
MRTALENKTAWNSTISALGYWHTLYTDKESPRLGRELSAYLLVY